LIAQKKVMHDQLFGNYSGFWIGLALNVLIVSRLLIAHEQQSGTAV
jgi:hypothetical protein